ncbi:MAG: autotransporter-associated beta strand repeat-containing protein, partial [Spartobacteria bacterium]
MKSTELHLPRLTTCLGLLVLVATAPLSSAGTIWDAGGASNNIDNATNWDSNSNPLFDGTAVVTFGTAGSSATINTNVNFLGIIFNRDAAFDLLNGAGSLTVGASGITASPSGTGQRIYTISESSLILGASQTWAITNNASTTILSVSSVVSDGTNTFGLTKTGNGRVYLGGANTYDGATLVNAGTLRISNNT